jgi:hypothetical protein
MERNGKIQLSTVRKVPKNFFWTGCFPTSIKRRKSSVVVDVPDHHHQASSSSQFWLLCCRRANVLRIHVLKSRMTDSTPSNTDCSIFGLVRHFNDEERYTNSTAAKDKNLEAMLDHAGQILF